MRMPQCFQIALLIDKSVPGHRLGEAVMWGRQYSRRPRTRGAAREAPKGVHGREEPKEA